MKIQKLNITILIFAWFYVILISSSFSQTILIKAGHLIEPKIGVIHQNQNIYIKDGKISRITSEDNVEKVDQTVDLSDSWILPGLIDCHVHITWNVPYRTNEWNQPFLEQSSALRSLRGIHNAKLILNAGFTTIKEIGNDVNYVTADIIKAIKYGWHQGPTIIYSGKIIAPYGGQFLDISPEYENFWLVDYIDADSPDEIRKAIRKNIFFGANTIKLVAQQHSYYYDLIDIETAVQEAKKAGIKVTAHVQGGEAARNVILGGASAIEHGFELDNDLLILMKDKGTFLVGTDFSFNNMYAYGFDSLAAAEKASRIEDRLKRAYDIGVKMAFGTDVVIDIEGMNRAESNLEILKTWKAAGIPPMEILKCMTSNAAELLGIDNNRGLLKDEYWADIVALKKDPLNDIENIKSVHFVMKEGTIIRNDQ